ncbi:hypothetical protein [Xanthomarina gelatinilytica]|uniref:hypothetical protein n=1 Tax=Xanthomarina gelatinilytica TaxID=1137281 RepID=UPI003AA9D05A
MKKSITFFACILICINLNAQWSGSSTTTGDIYRTGDVGIGVTAPEAMLTIGNTYTNGGYFLSMGNSVASDRRYFNFGLSPAGGVGYNIYSPNGKLRYDINAEPSITWIALRDNSQNEIFKVSNEINGASFLQLPKTDSKLIIGDYSSYIGSNGYKLFVRSGNAKVEGNIIANGKIGIGTNSFFDGLTEYKLSVDGKIRADGIKVYNTWADFVFEKNYDLPTLKEVEVYIEENGHLKNIPSACEVEKNGIDLGEMNKLLLQKIEELTLYVIELNKEVETLKNK